MPKLIFPYLVASLRNKEICIFIVENWHIHRTKNMKMIVNYLSIYFHDTRYRSYLSNTYFIVCIFYWKIQTQFWHNLHPEYTPYTIHFRNKTQAKGRLFYTTFLALEHYYGNRPPQGANNILSSSLLLPVNINQNQKSGP